MIKCTRRSALIGSSTAAFSLLAPKQVIATPGRRDSAPIAAAETARILRRELVPDPVVVESVSLLQRGDQYFVRVRDTDGGEGIALCNPNLMNGAWPIFLTRVAPFFKGKDLRDLERIQNDLYVWQLNYKWQGLAFWCVHAWMEFAALDLLGKRAGKSASELLGGPLRRDSGIYYASSNRGNSPEAEIAHLQKLVDRAEAKALKFRLGARMRYDDANSSYDVPLAIRIGRMLEDHGYGFYEEPVKFDHYEELAYVSRKLKVPMAFGEQEVSMRRFRWLIENDIVQIVQPDLLFNGGLIRALRVARMAAARGIKCVPHMSGSGLGSLYVMHFAGACPNTTDYQEYKGKEMVPHEIVGTGKPLTVVDGRVAIPTGSGLGVAFDPDYLRTAVEMALPGADLNGE